MPGCTMFARLKPGHACMIRYYMYTIRLMHSYDTCSIPFVSGVHALTIHVVYHSSSVHSLTPILQTCILLLYMHTIRLACILLLYMHTIRLACILLIRYYRRAFSYYYRFVALPPNLSPCMPFLSTRLVLIMNSVTTYG